MGESSDTVFRVHDLDTRLRNIEGSVSSIDEKVSRLLSHEGPISDLKHRIDVNEREIRRVDGRVNELNADLETEVSTTNMFIAKAVAFTGGVAAVASFIASKLFG
jgi:hypothetical protein